MEIVESIVRITQPNSPMMRPAENYFKKMSGRASAFLIDIEPGAKAYRYDVSIKLKWFEGQDYEKDLAKGTDEGLRSRNRNLCYEFLVEAYNNNRDQIPGEVIYDCKSTLYTNEPMKATVLEREILINTANSSDFIRTYCPVGSTAIITIKANSSGHELALDDFEQYKQRSTIHQEDRSIRTFLEMAIAQYGINDYKYTPIGAGKLFETTTNNLTQVNNGMVLRSGIAKGVRIVQGDGSDPVAALVVDTKVSPFFIEQPLIETVRAINRRGFPEMSNQRVWDDTKQILQHVRVEVSYARSRTFGIADIHRETPRNIQVNYNGGTITLDEYFRQAHGCDINHPDLPVIIPHYAKLPDDCANPETYFPLEVLVIMPDQRVPLEKMSQELSQRLLQANTLIPEERYRQVMRHCDELNLFGNNPVLQAFGIQIRRESNKCQINVRHAPKIEFNDGVKLDVNAQKADWRAPGKRYYLSDQIENWVVLCHHQYERPVQEFMAKYTEEARRRGIRFAEGPRIQPFPEVARWDTTFEQFANDNVQFVILIDSKNQDTHGILKYYEAIHKILTQHISIERVRDVLGHQRGRQTLENILNKTNMKYSGLNYRPVFENSLTRFKLEKNNVLVVGYDVANPPPMHPMERRLCQAVKQDLLSFDPSVVGITANMAVDPHNFVGDYFFQEALREGLNYGKLRDRFKWVLEVLDNFRQDARPQYIFVIRNGISEGQFAEMVQREIVALREGCKDFDANYRPQFVYVLGTKRHFKKFYAEENGIRNMTPGSVVDSKFVRADCPEFFMQSHYALKGVGKPVEYNILLDEIGCTKDEIEGFLNSLCYSHQIVNSAVSMPEPVFQADELAKRGRNNYITMKRLNEASIPRAGPHNFVDVNALDQMLSYKDNPIFIGTRFTA